MVETYLFAIERNGAVRKLQKQGFNNIPSTGGLMARLVSARITEAGIELKPLLKKAGLNLQQIEERSARIDAQNQVRFVNLAAEALRDDLLGFNLARSFDLREMGLLYYVLASAKSLGEAFPRVERYSRIANEGVSIRYFAGKRIKLTVDYVGIARHSDRHQIEAWMTGLVRTCQQLTGTSVHPSSITFTHYRDKIPSDLNRLLGSNVSFGTDADEITFASSIKNMPIISADPYLDELLITYCEEVLARRANRPGAFRSNVENAIAVLLPHGKARAPEVARKLGVSPRTLARRLSAEGLTYIGVLNDLRYDLAKRYLSEQGLSISRVAWLLGYQEVSAFAHAFKRKSGQTPNQVRRNPASARRSRKTH